MTGFTIRQTPATVATSADGRLFARRILFGSVDYKVDGKTVVNAYGTWTYRSYPEGGPLCGVIDGPVAPADVAVLVEMTRAIFAADDARSERVREAEFARRDARIDALDGIEHMRGGAYDPAAR